MNGADESQITDESAPTLPPQLQKLAGQSQLDFEIEFFAGILERKATYIEVLRVMGNNLTAKGEYHRGLDHDRQLIKLCPTDPVAHYNLACSYSLVEMVDLAMSTLRQAIDLGYTDVEYMLTDRDLQHVRKDPRFRELLAELGIG